MIRHVAEIPEHVRGAFFDIDGTLTDGGPVWAPLIKSRDVPKLRKAWLYGTGLPHYLMSRTGVVGQQGFRERWVVLMAGLMTGWTTERVNMMAETIVQRTLLPHVRRDVVALLQAHVQAGQPVILVSTMHEAIVTQFASTIGATGGVGTKIQFNNGVCAGRLIGQPCAGARKAEYAQAFLRMHDTDITLDSCAIYADSASDIPFLAQGGYPVAVYPDEPMRAAAAQNGWLIYAGADD